MKWVEKHLCPSLMNDLYEAIVIIWGSFFYNLFHLADGLIKVSHSWLFVPINHPEDPHN